MSASSSSGNRVALIGLGNAGTTLHLPALRGMTDVTIVGVCDTDEVRRERVGKAYRTSTFSAVDDMLARTTPDVVIIATPPSSHLPFCLQSLAAGAHVICEKPFVASVDEANTVLRAAAAADRRVALNHEFREMPIFRALRDHVVPEDLLFAQVWQLMDLPPWAEPGWRGQMLQRTLFEAGVHLVDFLMALFGECPVAVSATMGSSGARESDTDAIALVTLEFSRGRLAQVVQNRLCKGETQYFEVRAETTAASWRASFGGRARLSVGLHRSTRPHARIDFGVAGLAWREVGTKRTLLARNPKEPGMLATRFVLDKTLRAFRDGTEPPASGAVARDVLAVIAACYESSARGARVRIADALDGPLSSLTLGTSPNGGA